MHAALVNQRSIEELSSKLTGQRVVFLTTDSGYGPGSNRSEGDAFTPQSDYARTKDNASRTLLEHGATVLRLASLWGISASMRDDLLLHFLVKAAVAGEMPVIDEGSARRALVHVWDVVTVILWALTASEAPGRIYNVTGPDRLTKAALAMMVANHFRLPVRFSGRTGIDPDGRDFWMSSALPYGVVPKRSITLEEIRTLEHYYRSNS